MKVIQSCLTLCDLMDYRVHGVLQARTLEWVAFPFHKDLPNSGIEPRSPTLQVDSLPAEPQGKPKDDPASQVVGLQILMCFSGPSNLATGGFLAVLLLIDNCSDLPFGTQGRSWRLKSCLQELGDRKASMPESPTGSCLVSCGTDLQWPQPAMA